MTLGCELFQLTAHLLSLGLCLSFPTPTVLDGLLQRQDFGFAVRKLDPEPLLLLDGSVKIRKKFLVLLLCGRESHGEAVLPFLTGSE
ncbi:hypothetical protein TSH58_24475 [Azospirillum sp. TSH58]|nr:hypothetical protein TSH58_24475 [Azospirillum sp. TSH58]